MLTVKNTQWQSKVIHTQALKGRNGALSRGVTWNLAQNHNRLLKRTASLQLAMIMQWPLACQWASHATKCWNERRHAIKFIFGRIPRPNYRSFSPGISPCSLVRTILPCKVENNRHLPNPLRRRNFRLWDHTNYCSCIRSASDNRRRKDPPDTLFRIGLLFWR